MAAKGMKLISINIPNVMLDIIDDLIDQGIYRNRSVAIRSLLVKGIDEFLRERIQEATQVM